MGAYGEPVFSLPAALPPGAGLPTISGPCWNVYQEGCGDGRGVVRGAEGGMGRSTGRRVHLCKAALLEGKKGR